MSGTILQGNVFDLLPTLKKRSVDVVCTSPPSLKTSKPVQLPAVLENRFALRNVLVGEAFNGNHANGAGGVREVLITSNFCSVLHPVALEGAKPQDYFGLEPLHAKVWKQGTDYFFGQKVAHRPAVQRPAGFRVLRFWSKSSTEQLGKKLKALSLHHSDLNLSVVSGRNATLAPVRFGSFDP